MTAPPFEILHHGAVRGVTGSCHELRLVGPTVGPASAGQCPHECGPTEGQHPHECGPAGGQHPHECGPTGGQRPHQGGHTAEQRPHECGPTGGQRPHECGPAAGILIDCGLFQGAETSGEGADRDNLGIDFPVGHIRALVVTHVHIDHVGRVPYLLAAGFEGPIYCSLPSAILLPLVIEDALAVGATRDRKLIARTLERLKSQIRPLAYGKWARVDTGIGTGLEIRLQRAGHILGSAYVECRITTPNARHRVIFSGDLGAAHTPLLPEPEPPLGCHALVIESTYGDRRHEGRADRVRRLQRVIERALSNRGAVLIPAFSIGRTQELLYEIEEIIHARHDEPAARELPWNQLEVVVDSPLAAKFTRVYDRLKPFWDAEALQRVRAGRDPLSFEQVRTVNSHSDHLRVVEHLRKTRYPAIVIAASGMCAGGRIINYLKALIDDPVTDILFVGYQAAGTPGRAIQQYGPEGGWVELDGERFDIRAAIHTIGGYSAHADQADLLRFVTEMKRAPDTVRIVHGEAEAKETLQDELVRRLPSTNVMVPVVPSS
ncbi:MAG: MBL fold metallo-hydrolase [Pseudomonadales bacterium]|nr:MBL fold metallo-hydrolase [Pseudomonadales bacterium]